jgi:hypothetical protein
MEKLTSKEKVEVAQSPTRCPYCHEGCEPEDPRAIVCQACLSRHHDGCWREGGSKCASCGKTRALQATAPAIEVAPADVELLRKGAVREAVQAVMRRLSVAEVDAARALLERAAQELVGAKARPSVAHALINGIVAIVTVVMVFVFLMKVTRSL